MPQQPPPIVIEHTYNPDPSSGREAYVRTLEHLIEFILEEDAIEAKPEQVDSQRIA
jgi:hypothetical protein